jgi:hypothetical protein
MSTPTQNAEERRRSPRTAVDVEAQMRLRGFASTQGVILDLSPVGNLFLPEQPLDVKPRTVGYMRFAMPTALMWLEPRIVVRRIAKVLSPEGEERQAIAFEFRDLKPVEEQAIESGCADWTEHLTRVYPLAARVELTTLVGVRQVMRVGRIVNGGREAIRVRLRPGTALPVGSRLGLRGANYGIHGYLTHMRRSPTDTEVLIQLTDEWGRDFFLHDARRQTLALVRAGQPQSGTPARVIT